MAKQERRGRISRGFAPVSREDYDQFDPSKHSSSDEGFGSDLLFNTAVAPGGRVELIRPQYKEGPTYIRALNARSMRKPNDVLLGTRREAKESTFTPWFTHVPATAKFIGIKGGFRTSFVMWTADQKEFARSTCPYQILFSACYKAKKALNDHGQSTAGWNPKWNAYLTGGDGQGAEMSRPAGTYYMQAGVYAAGNKNFMEGERSKPYGLAAEDPLVVVQISDQAGSYLQELANARRVVKEGHTFDPKNPDAPFRFSPVGRQQGEIVVGGNIIAVFNPQHNGAFHPKKNKEMLRRSSWDGEKPDGNFWSYHVAMLDKVEIAGTEYLPGLDEDATNEVFNKTVYWYDIKDNDKKVNPGLIRIMSDEEKAEYVARAYAKEPGLLRFGWADQDYLKLEAVQAILTSRKTMVAATDPSDEGDEEETAADGPLFAKGKTPKAGKKGKGRRDVTQPEEEPEEVEDEETEDEEVEEETEEEAEEEAEEEDDSDDDSDEPEEEEETEDEEVEEDEEPEDEESEEEEPEGDDDEETEEEEDEEPEPKPKSPKGGKPSYLTPPAAAKKGKPKVADDDLFEDLTPKTKAKAGKPAVDEDDDDSEAQEVAAPKKGKAKAAKSDPEPKSKKAEEAKHADGLKAAKQRKEAELDEGVKAAKAAADRASARKNPAKTPPPPSKGGTASRKK